MTIRKRLLTGYLLVMVLMLAGFSVAMYLVTRLRLTAEIDADLEGRIENFVNNLNVSGDEVELEVRKVDREHDFFWTISLPDGTQVDHSAAYGQVQITPPGEGEKVGSTVFWDTEAGDGPAMRCARRRLDFGRVPRKLKIITIHRNEQLEITEKSARYTHGVTALVIDAGAPLAARDEALNTLVFILSIAVPTMLALSSIGGIYLVSRALDPVVAITQAASNVGPGNLGARVPVATDTDEIGRLSSVINGMLDRIAEGFERERQFTGDASHELRTPLTVLRGDIEVSLRKTRSQEEYRQVLLRCLDEAGRMERVVEGMLFLARADAGRIKPDSLPVDLGALLTRLINAVRRLPGAPEIRARTFGQLNMQVRGSLNLLETLFNNLLENAVKHGNEPITLEVTDAGPGWAVSIVDSGPGIAEEELAHLFDRFYRTDKARSRATGGVGLGLSICKWITEAHHGTIVVKNGATGGVRFTVTLPKARATYEAMPSPVPGAPKSSQMAVPADAAGVVGAEEAAGARAVRLAGSQAGVGVGGAGSGAGSDAGEGAGEGAGGGAGGGASLRSGRSDTGELGAAGAMSARGVAGAAGSVGAAGVPGAADGASGPPPA